MKRVIQCWLEPLLEPMLEPLSALEPPAGTPLPALEPPFCTLSPGGYLRHRFLQEGHQMHPPGSNFSSVDAVPFSSVPCGLAKGKPLPGRSVS